MDAFNDDDAELNSFLRTLSPVHIQQSTTSPSLDQRSPSLGVSTSTFQPNQQHSQSQSQQSASPFGFLDPDSYQLAQGQLQNQDWWASSSAMGSADRPVVGRDGGAGEAGGARSVPRPGYTMEEYASLIAERIQNISQNSNSNDSHNHTFRSSLSASGDYREAGSGYATPSYASSYGSYQDDLGAFDGASSNGDLTADSGYNLNGDDHDSKGDVANADFFSSFDNFNCQSLAQDPAELDVPLPSDSDSHQPGWPFNRSLTGQSSASHLAVNLHLSAPKRTSTMETDATICPEPPAPRIRMPPAHQSSLPSSHLSSFDFASDTLSAASPENLSEEPVAWPESPKGMSEKSFFEGDILSAHSGSSYDQPIPSPRLVSSKVSSTAAPLQSQSHTSDSKASPQNSANYDSQPKPSVPCASGSSSSSPSRFNIQQLSLSNSAPPPISITPSQSPSSTSSPSNSNQWSSPILQNSSGNLNLSPTEPDEQLFRNAGSLPPTNPRLISLGQMPQAGGSQGLSDQLQINIVPSTPTMGLAGTKTQSSNEFAYAISRAVRSPVHGSSSTGSSPRARSSPTTQNVPSQSRLVSSSPVQQPQTFGSFNGHPSTSPTSPAPETPSFFPQTVTLASNGSEEMSWLSSLGNAATEPNIQSQITVSPPQADKTLLPNLIEPDRIYL
ncbi:hypothetical protein [Phaffia rhodozyma]|uniref:Uncharacterized protein n=1 Tax=Phaffia rhodozyma TaxID=264483 RepID=A0A0F7SMP7_PHARH|nr:hypothetical protein [Phaffia rhodozyma]